MRPLHQLPVGFTFATRLLPYCFTKPGQFGRSQRPLARSSFLPGGPAHIGFIAILN